MKVEQHITEVKELIDKYGLLPVASALETTERGVSYWIADKDRKTPRKETVQKIHELFLSHKAGHGLGSNGLKDASEIFRNKYIESLQRERDVLQRENERLQRDLDLSLGELRHNILLARAIGEVTQELLVDYLEKSDRKKYAELIDNVSTKNFETYQKLKAEGSFAYVGK